MLVKYQEPLKNSSLQELKPKPQSSSSRENPRQFIQLAVCVDVTTGNIQMGNGF